MVTLMGHMREGVLNALRATARGEPDAEQGLLVADLGCIYQQHLRWQRSLPGIEPFYGKPFHEFSSAMFLVARSLMS
jgi:hypothetical protein